VADPHAPLSPEQTYELIDRIKGGDERALELLLARLLPRLQRWAHGRLPSGARGMLDTADVVQDVVIRSVQHMNGFEYRGQGAFLAYLRRGVLNRLQDERRKLVSRPRQAEMPAHIASDDTSPLDRLIGAENIDRYESALQRLDAADQAAIVGRFEWGYGYADLAVVLGKPTPGAARAAVLRAVNRLIAGTRGA
jgi:RNA polymerase sigma-70 factor (ECF subfamily)